MKLKKACLALIMGSTLLPGCQLFEGLTTPPSSVPQGTAVGVSPSRTPGPRGAPQPQLVSPDPRCQSSSRALDLLRSYRYEYGLRSERDGTTITIRGAAAGPQREEMIFQTGNQGYRVIRAGESTWVGEGEAWRKVTATEALQLQQWGLARSWGAMAEGIGQDARFLGTESIAGVPAFHCATGFRRWAGLFGEATTSEGEVWLAQEGRWPLRYRFTGQMLMVDGQTVGLEANLALYQINDPSVTILAPP